MAIKRSYIVDTEWADGTDPLTIAEFDTELRGLMHRMQHRRLPWGFLDVTVTEREA